jgi:hypothetical protein
MKGKTTAQPAKIILDANALDRYLRPLAFSAHIGI